MWFFYLFLAILPFSFALNPTSGIDLAINRVLAALLILVALAIGFKRRSLTISSSPLSLSLALFLAWAALSLAWAPDLTLAGRKLLFLLNFLPLFWFLPVLILLPRLRPGVLLYPGLIVTLIGVTQFILQFIVGLSPVLAFWRAITPFFAGQTFGEQIIRFSSWLVAINGTTIFRATALFPDGHIFGFYLAFIIPLALAYRRKFIAALATLALLFTLSRQAYVGATGALLAFIVFALAGKAKNQKPKSQTTMQNPRLRSRNFKFFVVVLAFVFFVLVLVSTPIGARLLSSFNLGEGSNSERLLNWSQALQLISSHPVLGVGLGNYAHVLNPLLPSRAPVYAHNLYLDIGAELGLIGLLLFLLIVFFSLTASYKINRAVFFTLVWFYLQSLFDMPLFSVHILPLFVLFLAWADANMQNINTQVRTF